MTCTPQKRLLAILDDSLTSLIKELAGIAGTPIALLDSDGTPVLETEGWPGSDGVIPSAYGPVISIPIRVSDATLGSLVASTDSKDVERLMGSLADHLARHCDLEVGMSEMTDQLSQSYDEISLVYRLAGVIKPEEDLRANASRTLAETVDLLEDRFLIVSIPEDDCIIWSASPKMSVPESLRWVSDNHSCIQPICRKLKVQTPQSTQPGWMRHQGTVPTPYGNVEYAVLPIRVRSDVAGFGGLFRTAAEPPFVTGELQLVESLVQQLSTAATNRKLNRELYRLIFDVMRGLVAAIEAKDKYTSGHSERVYRISILIAKALGSSRADIKTLSWAALLHDIGKIAISGQVLRKPSSLTKEEYEIIKTHPARGCRVLEPIRHLGGILPGIRHHHERFDGEGYPDQLKGKEIPFMARIIGISDAFDAMVSARPYRPARTLEYALDEIRSCSGTQFDPEIAAVFLELAQQGKLRRLLQESAMDRLAPQRHQAESPTSDDESWAGSPARTTDCRKREPEQSMKR